MRKISLLAVALLFGVTLTAQAAMYTWVDKDGKKHFGDKVPPEYAKQVQSVGIKKMNTMEQPPALNTARAETTPSASRPSPRANVQQAADADSCEAQKSAYNASQACFSRCRITNQDELNADGSMSPHVNNVAACGHCTDVKKPNCD